jgi:hypothetical protein
MRRKATQQSTVGFPPPKLSPKQERMLADLSRMIGDAVIETAVADGHLDPRGKDEDQWQKDVVKYLRRAAKADTFAWNIDHRGTLLDEARRLKKAGQMERAVLHYATWTEHMLNSFIASLLRRNKLSEDWVRSVIRDTGLRAKYVFATLLFGCKPSSAIADAIQVISERRNQFVHYKWLYHEELQGENQKKQYVGAVLRAEKVVRHLIAVEDRYIHHRHTAHAARQLRTAPTKSAPKIT